MAPSVSEHRTLSEVQFAGLVGELKADPARRALLTDLLREDNPIYDQRGTAATIRMRGWVILALTHGGLPDSALLFVLEELDNGRDAYLVAAAARALRSYANPTAAFAPLLTRALGNIRDHDDDVCLERYGAYTVSKGGTSAVQEVLATLCWLGADAHGVLPELEVLRANKSGALSSSLVEDVGRAMEAIRLQATTRASSGGHCCEIPAADGHVRTWGLGSAGDGDPITSTVFEDQDGSRIGFGDFFRGQPSVVAFFYTRCNNPQKCSLTVAKLGRVQGLLMERGLAARIRTAAITYDPGFDGPERLRGYGQSRGMRMDAGHRMLRATEGMNTLRAYFRLGVNYIESLVNRHRVEVYVLDAAGRIAASFQRLQWDERQVVDEAVRLLDDAVA